MSGRAVVAKSGGQSGCGATTPGVNSPAALPVRLCGRWRRARFSSPEKARSCRFAWELAPGPIQVETHRGEFMFFAQTLLHTPKPRSRGGFSLVAWGFDPRAVCPRPQGREGRRERLSEGERRTASPVFLRPCGVLPAGTRRDAFLRVRVRRQEVNSPAALPVRLCGRWRRARFSSPGEARSGYTALE